MELINKGTIITLKVLCAYVLRRHNLMYIDSLIEEQSFAELVVFTIEHLLLQKKLKKNLKLKDLALII